MVILLFFHTIKVNADTVKLQKIHKGFIFLLYTLPFKSLLCELIKNTVKKEYCKNII